MLVPKNFANCWIEMVLHPIEITPKTITPSPPKTLLYNEGDRFSPTKFFSCSAFKTKIKNGKGGIKVHLKGL